MLKPAKPPVLYSLPACRPNLPLFRSKSRYLLRSLNSAGGTLRRVRRRLAADNDGALSVLAGSIGAEMERRQVVARVQ